MREIKFRGKRLENGAWIEGYYVYDKLHGGHYLVISVGEHQEDDKWEKIEPKTIGQYTGVKDIKGVEIYEGDIVRIRHPYGGSDFSDTKGEVYFIGNKEGAFYHGNQSGRPPKRMWEYAEVIGNIHDNPDLLEGAE